MSDVRIKPYSTYTLSFSNEDYFGTSPTVLKGRKIFLRVHNAYHHHLAVAIGETSKGSRWVFLFSQSIGRGSLKAK